MVVGVTSKIIFVLAQSTQGLRALVQAEEVRYSSIMEQPLEEHPAEEALEPAAPQRRNDHAI